MDAEGHLVLEDDPYLAVCGYDSYGPVRLYSKHTDWRGQRYNLLEDGTVQMQNNPESYWGTDEKA